MLKFLGFVAGLMACPIVAALIVRRELLGPVGAMVRLAKSTYRIVFGHCTDAVRVEARQIFMITALLVSLVFYLPLGRERLLVAVVWFFVSLLSTARYLDNQYHMQWRPWLGLILVAVVLAGASVLMWSSNTKNVFIPLAWYVFALGYQLPDWVQRRLKKAKDRLVLNITLLRALAALYGRPL